MELAVRYVFLLIAVKVKVYARKHQPALRKGSQLVVTLARAPPKNEKKRNNRDERGSGKLSAMRSGLRLALLKPAALPVTPHQFPMITVVIVEVYFASCFCDLV